jgi:hypothetical protein
MVARGYTRLLAALVVVVASAAVTAAPASSSQLIDRNARNVRLAVNKRGEALLTYRVGRRVRRVLAWGALNARSPNPNVPQQRFKKDYAGGWGKYRTTYWRTFRNSCRRYDGPKLAWFVTGCKAVDGSYWAVQSWQTPLPDLGFAPWLPKLGAWELHLSHWTGPLAGIEAYTDWIYGGRYHDIFGRLTYRGNPVYGFSTTKFGAPLDGYGRLVYLDTYDSAYGRGWRRENAFVAHNPTGVFCYGFYPFDPTRNGYVHPPGETAMRGPGNGSRYRIIVNGPGVTPDVTWTGPGLHDYNARNPADVDYEQARNAQLDRFVGIDRLCRQH